MSPTGSIAEFTTTNEEINKNDVSLVVIKQFSLLCPEMPSDLYLIISNQFCFLFYFTFMSSAPKLCHFNGF